MCTNLLLPALTSTDHKKESPVLAFPDWGRSGDGGEEVGRDRSGFPWRGSVGRQRQEWSSQQSYEVDEAESEWAMVTQ